MKQKSEYDKKAEAFLAKTNTTFKAGFLRYGKHFDDDKESRDVWRITLTRGNRAYSFDFGQSIAHSGRYILRIDGSKTNGFKSMGAHHKNPDFEEPTPYDVLACLTKYEPGTFEDFCGDFGYNTDSKRAEKTYNAVKEEWLQVQTLWTDEEISELQEIN
jgi:hypothetical protein